MAWFSKKKQSRPSVKLSDNQTLKELLLNQTDVGVNNALQISTVYACVRVLSESIGMLPIKLYKMRGSNRELDTKHPMYKCLAIQPNSYMTSIEFWEYAIKCLSMTGNFYALIGRNGLGQTVELLPIAPTAVYVKQNTDYSVVYTVTTVEGKTYNLPQKDIFHVKLFTKDCIHGISPIAEAKSMLETDMATSQHASNLFKNGAISTGAIEIDTMLNDDEFQAFKDELQVGYTGANAYRPMILEGGAKWKNISISNSDSQFLETRKFNREEIAKIFRVPPHLIGDLEHATFSNIEHQAIEFVQYSLIPYIRKIEQRILVDLFTPEEQTQYYVKFNVNALLRGDSKSRNEAYRIAIDSGWMCVNEAREQEDLNPIKGGDVFRVPLNYGYLDSNGQIVNPNMSETDTASKEETENED